MFIELHVKNHFYDDPSPKLEILVVEDIGRIYEAKGVTVVIKRVVNRDADRIEVQESLEEVRQILKEAGILIGSKKAIV